jgi:hypothetical protein
MNKDLWEDFATDIEKDINNISTSDSNNSQDINDQWNKIQKIIIETANNKIPNKKVTTQEYRTKFSRDLSEKISLIRRQIRF